MKETLETLVDNEEHGFVLERVEEAMIVVEEEVVEDLGDAEPPWESRTIENSAEKSEIDAKEDSAQPPQHMPCEKSDGTDQEVDSMGSDDLESSSPSHEFTSATEFLEPAEPYPNEYEDDPTAADRKKIIPHSRKFLALGYTPPFFTAPDEIVTPSAASSSSTAAPAPPTTPPAAPEPIYHLVEEDDHEEETPTQVAQAGPEQAAPQQEEPHQIQAADPEISIQSKPPLKQTDPQHTGMDAVGEEVNINELRDIDCEEDNNNSEEEFEANYEVADEKDDGDPVGNSAVQNEAHAIVSQHPFGVPSFVQTLDLEAMHAPKFPKYVNMGEGNVAAEDELYVEFEQHMGLDAVGKKVNVDEFENIDWKEDNNNSE
nr:zinc finger protein 526-like [Arachis hypogaea]